MHINIGLGRGDSKQTSIKGKTKGKGRGPTDPVKQERLLEFQGKKWAQKELIDEYKNADPEQRIQIASQLLGKVIKPITKRSPEELLEDKVNTDLLEDPEYINAFKQAKIAEYRARQAAAEKFEENPIAMGLTGNPIIDAANQIAAMNQLKEALGVEDDSGKGGFFSGMTLEGLAAVLHEAKGFTGGAQQTVYMIPTENGQWRAGTEAEAAQLTARMQLAPPMAPPKAPPQPQQPQPRIPKTQTGDQRPPPRNPNQTATGTETVDSLSFNLEDWLPYLDEDPQEFAGHLVDVMSNDPESIEAKVMRFIYESGDIDTLCSKLSVYRVIASPAEIEVVDRLQGDKLEWLVRVLELVKGYFDGGKNGESI